MRLAVVLIILLQSACTAVAPQQPVPRAVAEPVRTEIGGVLSGETVLDGAYTMTSDILIPAGSRLLIRPGTHIVVRPAETTKIDPEFLSSQTELLVRGVLRIEGTAAAPVVITPSGHFSASEPAWAGLLLDHARSSSIRHLQVSGAETGLLLIEADAGIADSVLLANRYGLVIQGGAPLLERNLIADGEGGLYIWTQAAPLLVGNVIRGNAEEGIYIDRSSSPQFHADRCEANAIGLVAAVRPDANDLLLLNNAESWRQLPKRQEPGQ